MRGIYKITNAVNGKVYIGKSENIHHRWKQHIRELNKTNMAMHIFKMLGINILKQILNFLLYMKH